MSDERRSIPSTSPTAVTAPPHTWSPDADGAAPALDTSLEVVADRYEDLGLLGVGGMGEVRRVRDRVLRRTMAMKVLAPHLVAHPAAVARFVEEAQTTAQLQHPSIAPVHELGRLPDGRPFFTLKEVVGVTLQVVLRHRVSAGPELRRRVDVFQRACEAVAYAHARGVVHRDLKPSNVMIGAFGEVLVLDWGIARVTGAPLDRTATPVMTERVASPSEHHSGLGRVAGTPKYMAPEQARGGAIGPYTDVWALGAMLSEILCGSPQVRLLAPDAPPELAALAREACSALVADRPAHAGLLAERVAAWLQGALREEQALELVRSASSRLVEVRSLRGQAKDLRAAAKLALDAIPSHASVGQKRPHWAALERADEIASRAAILDAHVTQELRAALVQAPDLAEAHELVADQLLERHQGAERGGDLVEAARLEELLRAHARPRHRPYLEGSGAITLVTDPPGVRVDLYKYELQDRVLRPAFVRALGPTPLLAIPVPHGSYVCVVHAAGGEVRVPVWVRRGGHWSQVPPGESGPSPIRLPRAGELGSDDLLVPAGPALVGGDPEAFLSLPEREVWVDAFVIRRHPVLETEFLEFLRSLPPADALRHAPRNEPALGDLLWEQRGGAFVLDEGHGRLPAHGIDHAGALAYAHWFAAHTGSDWRLPGDVEWEKAARGVDGRRFPFGNFADGTFFCHAASHAGSPRVYPVDAFPVDESPYGVRGLAGNVRDWVQDRYERHGPPLVEGRMAVVEDPSPDATRIQRGGAWSFMEQNGRAATRWWQDPRFRHTASGFRLARSFV